MKKYYLFFILSIALFFFHAVVTKHAIYGDGNGYYSYTHALFFEKRLNFDPIYGHLGNFQGTKYIFSRVFWDTGYTNLGAIRQNPYLIGTGIVWLPSMAFISLINLWLNLGADKYSLIYELGPGISGIVLMISGLYFLEKHLLNFFSSKSVFWTILILFFGSNIFYYTAFEPALSHQPSFFLISFLLYWTYRFKPNAKNIFVLGLLSGLLVITRIADAILLIPILLQVWRKLPNLKRLVFPVAGFLIAVSPQLLSQGLMYGSVFTSPYLTGQSGTWQVNIVHFFEYLFSFKRGLFFWTPVLMIGTIGLVKQRKILILCVILAVWLISSSWSAYLSAGFGQRFSFSLIPFFAYGIAFVFDKLEEAEIVLYCIPFAIWNIILLVGFYVLKLGR